MSDISPELRLLRAMFRQVELDSTASAEPRHRRDVQHFLKDGELTWWDTFRGCDGALERQMRQRLAARRAQCPRRESPQLAFRFSEEP